MWYTAQMKMISEWLTERHDISLHHYQLSSLQNITKVRLSLANISPVLEQIDRSTVLARRYISD